MFGEYLSVENLFIAVEAVLFFALELAVWAITTKPAWRQIGDAVLLIACGVGAACISLLIVALLQNIFITYVTLTGFSFLIAGLARDWTDIGPILSSALGGRCLLDVRVGVPGLLTCPSYLGRRFPVERRTGAVGRSFRCRSSHRAIVPAPRRPA
jgi:hypothetical protein